MQILGDTAVSAGPGALQVCSGVWHSRGELQLCGLVRRVEEALGFEAPAADEVGHGGDVGGGPEHARALEAGGELFAEALHRAAADGQAAGLVVRVVHPRSVLVEEAGEGEHLALLLRVEIEQRQVAQPLSHVCRAVSLEAATPVLVMRKQNGAG